MITGKVSILVPIYGVEKYIEQCINSLFHQNYKNIEFIFVNDCTKDNSINILNKVVDSYPQAIQDKVKVIHHSSNKGISGTRNTLLNNATGEFILFVDSDDYLEPNAIKDLIEKQNQLNVDILFSNYYLVSSNSSKRVRKIIPQSKIEYLIDVIYRKNYLNIWGNLIKRDLFENIIFIEGANFGEDYGVLPKLIFKANSINFLEKEIYNYRLLNEESYTKNITTKSIDDILISYNSILDFFKENNNHQLIRETMNSFYILKAQVIKTTKGNEILLNYFEQKIKHFPKKYPASNTIINNLINFVFDNNTSLCSIIIKKIKK